MASRLPFRPLAETSLAPTQLFASSADAPRSRRPNDWLVAALTLLLVVLAGWAASGNASIDARVAASFENTPGWLDFLARVAYVGAGAYTAALIVVGVFRGGKRAIRRDMLIAVTSTMALAVIAGWATVGEWPDLIPEFVDPGDILSYPVLRLTLLTAVLATASPHLTLPMRKTGRRVLVAGAIGGVVLGVANISGLVGGLALGRGVAAVIHLLYGSPAGLPATERLVAALGRLGFPDATVELLPRQPVGVALACATLPDGDRLRVKVYGRDAADAQLAAKVWRALWYRDAGPTISLSGLQQAEHEAVASLLAERSGVPVPPILTAGQDVDENAFLVTGWPSEHALAELDAEAVTDELIDRCWASLRALHDAGIAHGSIAPESLLVGDAHVTLSDLSEASLSAVDRRIQGDVASMLASHVVVAGAERAVAGAVRNLEPDRVEAALPYMQDAMLQPDLRRRVKKVAKLATLTHLLLEQVEVEKPEMAEVRRVTLGDILLVVFGIFAANAILSQIAEIGFDTLADELANASFGFLVTAFVIGLTGYYGDVVSIRAAVGGPVPLAPAALLQSAKRFIGLAVPSMAGRVALDVRFLQKLGLPATTALAQGPLIGFIGFLAEVLILVICAWSIGQELETDDLDAGNAGAILVGVGAIVVVGLVVLLAVPKLRNMVMPPVMAAVRSAADVVRDPRRVGRIFAGQLFDRVTSGLALAATLAAFDVRILFASVLFVAIGTGLIQGLAPVPGGIGVAEATMTALLTGVGVDPEVAFAAAITHRLITSYLPPVLGWFSFRWLTDNGYL